MIEVLIVVVILGIVAGTVLPRFHDATGDAREAALLRTLQTLRSQIELYRHEHLGMPPAEGSLDPRDFYRALFRSSDADGTTGPPGTKPYGPYLLGQMPPNPYNNGRAVKIVPNIESVVPDESATLGGQTVGWFYESRTGRIRANAEGVASDGTPLFEL